MHAPQGWQSHQSRPQRQHPFQPLSMQQQQLLEAKKQSLLAKSLAEPFVQREEPFVQREEQPE